MIATSCPRTRSDGSDMIRCGLGKTSRLPTPLSARLLWTGHPAPNGINAIKYQIQRVNGGILVATNHKKRYQEVAEAQRACPEAQLLANNIGTKSTFDAKPLHSSFTLQKCFIHNLARFNKKAQLLGFRILMILSHHLAQPYSALQLSCLMGQLVKVHPLPSPPRYPSFNAPTAPFSLKSSTMSPETQEFYSASETCEEYAQSWLSTSLTGFTKDHLGFTADSEHELIQLCETVLDFQEPIETGRLSSFQKCFHSLRAWPMESATNSAAWHFQQRR